MKGRYRRAGCVPDHGVDRAPDLMGAPDETVMRRWEGAGR
jgi:hypothetical protein